MFSCCSMLLLPFTAAVKLAKPALSCLYELSVKIVGGTFSSWDAMRSG